jgi:hypothetical protein
VKAVLTMAHDVFISHSHEDKPAADAACAALEARGIRCWIAPRDIDPGQDWAASIVEAIRGAQIMLLVFSRHANQSAQVKREVERAASSGKAILPLRIDDVLPEAALEYYLSTPHWLDAITKPFEAHLEKLADACASLLAVTGRSPQDATSDRAPVVAALATEQPQPPIRGNVSTSAPAEIPPAGRQPSMVLWWRHKSPRAQRQLVLTVVTVVILGTAGTITGYLLRPDSPASHTTTAQPAQAAGQTAQPAPAPGPTATTTTSPSAAAAVPELAPFVGRWKNHTGILVIRQTGSGHLAYQDLNACPSCRSRADLPTGTVDFTLTSVSNDVATGIIEASSNEQNVVVGSDVTAQLVAGSPSGQTVQISMGRNLGGAFCDDIAEAAGECGA